MKSTNKARGRSRPARSAGKALLAVTLLALAAGCRSNKAPTSENFIRALNAWYSNRNDCLFPGGLRFPYEVGTLGKSAQEARAMDSLVSAGLMIRDEDRTIHVNRYSLTAAGARASNRLCYGHREVTGIESFSQPAIEDGLRVTRVTYHYRVLDVPNWAKAEAVQQAYPEMARAVRGEAIGSDKLALTMAGWQRPE